METKTDIDLIVAGVDVGSLYTKVVLLKPDARKQERPSIVSYCMNRSGGLYKGAADKAVGDVLKLAGLQMGDIDYVVSTGYGRHLVSYGGSEITEISCHAYGAKFLFPEAHTVIDIGGQDSKVISVDDKGGVYSFVMNDKCAAGTGRFLEVMAEGLDFGLRQMGELSLLSDKNISLSSTCTVFAESEIISLLSEGYDKGDIAAGIYRAIANRMMALVARNGGVEERVVMSGGVAKSIGMVRALEKRMGTSLLIAEEPQIIGALGAALFAAERATEGRKARR